MRVWSGFAGAALALLSFCARAEQSTPLPILSVDVAGARAPFALQTLAGETMDPSKLREDVKRLWASGYFEDVRVEQAEDEAGIRLIFRLTEKRRLRVRYVEVEPKTSGITHTLAPDTPVDTRIAQAAAAEIRGQLVAQGHPDAKVEAEVAPVDSSRADVRLKIDKGTHIRIKDVEFSGRLGAKPDELRKALRATKPKTMLPGIWKVQPGYSEDAVLSDAANLQSFLYRRGFLEARVRKDSLDLHSGDSRLRFHLDSGPKYGVRSVFVHRPEGGIKPIVPKDGEFPVKDVCGAFFEERRKAEKNGVMDFDARLEILDVPRLAGTKGTEKWADLDARVELGPAYQVGRIEFRGNRALSDIALRRSMMLDEGQPLDQMLLRKTMARLNRTGLFEPISPESVKINTAPGRSVADVTIHLKERKRGHWALSGPVGPMSIAGPLQFAIGSRLPSWGRGIFELSTYTASISFMTFAPAARVLPFLPNKRFIALATLARPQLPGQRWLSGFTIAPQLGWQGMLLGYGMGQSRDLLAGVWQSDRDFTPPIEVKIVRGSGPDAPIEGAMLCEMPATKLDRARQVGSITSGIVFGLSPF